MYINRIRICGATLTLPAPVAAGWSKFFKQTLIHLIQTEGTTTSLIPAKSDQWLGQPRNLTTLTLINRDNGGGREAVGTLVPGIVSQRKPE